jgi:hypothetical protein
MFNIQCSIEEIRIKILRINGMRRALTKLDRWDLPKSDKFPHLKGRGLYEWELTFLYHFPVQEGFGSPGRIMWRRVLFPLCHAGHS